jgi:hypothetical protein
MPAGVLIHGPGNMNCGQLAPLCKDSEDLESKSQPRRGRTSADPSVMPIGPKSPSPDPNPISDSLIWLLASERFSECPFVCLVAHPTVVLNP